MSTPSIDPAPMPLAEAVGILRSLVAEGESRSSSMDEEEAGLAAASVLAELDRRGERITAALALHVEQTVEIEDRHNGYYDVRVCADCGADWDTDDGPGCPTRRALAEETP